MFDVLIREAGARFGLGEKALPLVQMLLAYMTNKANGGLMGFLEKFKAAGFGPIIQSWLGGGPLAQPISNSQLETVLGSSGGLLSLLTSRLGVERDSATSALGYLLPAVVGKLTPGGSIPSSLPPEVASMAAAGESLMAAPVVEQVAPSGGFMKWLPWIVVAVAVLLGLGYCAKQKTAETTPAAVPAPASAPASDAVRADWGGGAPASEPAPAAAPEAPASAPAAAPMEAPASAVSTAAPMAATDEPTGAAVVASQSGDVPMLKVYFDSGKTAVAAEFADKAKALVDYLKGHADAKAVISGFNDPTGDPAKNAELSKNRAQAVQAALVAAGLGQERTVLEKPAETSGTGASNAASRRVEVTVRP